MFRKPIIFYINFYYKLSFWDKFITFPTYLLTKFRDKLQKWQNFQGRYKLVNRSRNHNNLLMVICGYKEDLWPYTLGLVAKYVDTCDVDVVLLLPGVENSYLLELAEERSWSYLSTRSNKLSLAQNLVVKKFLHADWIYKIDEDIFISENFIVGLKQCFNEAITNGEFHPGMVVPKMNVNGFGYLHVLNQTGHLDDFKNKFEITRSACIDIPVHSCGDAAKYMWSLTFSKSLFMTHTCIGPTYVPIPHRFSIGAFLVKRSLISEMGYFNVTFDGVLGEEEKQICNFCFESSQPILMANLCFAGHFAFGPQYESMLDYLKSNQSKFQDLL